MPVLNDKALSGYRRLRRLKNRLLNIVDQPIVVLVYHRVTILSSDPQQLAVSPENFRSQIQFLKRNFPVVSFDEDWTDLSKPSVAITFDDGYADNALEALPLLEEFEVPATFFVSTGTLGTRKEFWWDDLERIVMADATRPEKFRLEDEEYGMDWSTLTRGQRLALYKDLQFIFGNARPGRRDAWMGQVRKWAGLKTAGREINRSLTENELKRLACSGWATIGAHTVTHTPLSILSEDEQWHEIVSSKDHLERILGQRIKVFSYPFGKKTHYNRTSVRICREAGFSKAASNFPGQAHRWTDPYQIPRQLVRNWDAETFAAKMKGFWT